ncbi:oxysterol-binding protein homolog 3 [[Candida] railenensis]|uniref:Oxysterol-binding protein homolog 3 n=1 Tax=[Candida] railenensis TaxID=45579 RepID=A0A9P0VZF8_9ASCO|nr:oxysterol-binding protein homolog 3 [[Candida] railenensis]
METLEVHSKDFLVKWIHAPDNSVIDWQAKPLKKSINFAIYKKNETSVSETMPPAPKFLSEASDSSNGVDPLSNGSSQNRGETVNGSGNGSSNSKAHNPNSGSSSGPNASLTPNVNASNSASDRERRKSVTAGNSRLRSSSVVSVNEFSESVSSIYKTLSRSNTKTSSFNSNLTNSDLTLVKDYKKLVSGELVHGKFEIKQGGVYAFIFDNSFSKTIGKKILFSTKIINSGKGIGTYSENSIRSIDPKSRVTNSNSNSTTSMSSVVTAASSRSTSSPVPVPPTSQGTNDLRQNSFSANSKGRGQPQGSSRDLQSILRPKNGELLQGTLMKRRRKKLQGFTKRFFVLNFKYGTLSYFKINDNKLRGQMPIKHSIVSANSKNREIIIDSGMEAWDLKAANSEVFKSWVDAFNQIKKSHFDAKPLSATDHRKDKSLSPSASNNLEVSSRLQRISAKLSGLEVDSQQSKLLLSEIKADIGDIIGILNSTENEVDTDEDDSFSVKSDNDFYDAKEYLDAINSGVVFLNDPVSTTSSEDGKRKISSKSVLAMGLPDGSIGTASRLQSKQSDEDDESEAEVEISSSSEDEESEIEVTVVKTISIVDDYDKSLYPLPFEPIKREWDIPECTHSPPSMLSFLRKNVGKDLSQVAMPVTLNEPISTLEKYSEMMEYCQMIDNAIQANCDASTGERILRIAAFAISSLSSMRAKERNIRKPFTPLLGETYELVREDFGLRMITEKVSHRPPVYAIFAETKDWDFTFCPSPEQKFWGKNAEIITRGVAKLTIKTTGEVFSWSQPSTMLKNIIAGEKYGEPNGTTTVKSSFGYKAIVEFAKGGMFSGRQEDLTIKAFSQDKSQLPYEVEGKWTDSLTLKTHTTERTIWSVGELMPNPAKKFGFTKFAGTLNKITEVEKGKIPPTDSRLRPDLQVYLEGDVDAAEELKVKLEEDQRERRKESEISGTEHTPAFFKKVSEDSVMEWEYIRGEKSYWNRRKAGDWDDLLKIW